ncbi:peptidoglycan recognition protein family protein [Companilactobacillus keshanensis]|uniref:N-acetylmuramoyl-L-alanine amidase family protein n=1 Tax=Companilactobacillus keshanensis TaxID=2486003 RepID=A0ABW4BT10_9LACO|nr:peptidoglycan recognition family protein [Companilactobacillus keshanensis]
MVSKKRLMATLATSVALAGAGYVTVNQVVPQVSIQQTVKASAINDYIAANNIKPVSIQNEEGTFSQWFGYANGVGKPIGIVIHETATPGASARNEVTYFNREWQNAQTYVHAFVDANEIINIHNTDYGVWGAGHTANNNYVQVELCEVNTTDEFARSVSNDAYYVASKLIQYNLPFTPGVTVVSHDDISKMYGETNHNDPVGYFANWGYSMSQFDELVGQYYNNLKNSGSVDGDGSSTNGGGDDTNNNTGNSDVVGVTQVNNPNGSYVPIYMFNEDTGLPEKQTVRALANNTPWAVAETKTFDGHVYYRVSVKEWVMDTYSQYSAF